MSSTAYLPISKTKFVKLASRPNGLVIPLESFGYPQVHATVYVRIISGSVRRFNIHIAHDITHEQIFSVNFVIEDEKVKAYFENRLEEMKKIVQKFSEKFKKHSISSAGLICIDCCVKQHTHEYDFSQRENAKASWKKIMALNYKEINSPVCNDPRHVMQYDPKRKRVLYKGIGSIVTQTQSDKYTDAIFSCMFSEDLEKKLQRIFKDIRKALAKYKRRIGTSSAGLAVNS